VGKKIAASKGPAWMDVQLSVLSLPPVAEISLGRPVTEPFIVWINSVEAETQERENNGSWVTRRVKDSGYRSNSKSRCAIFKTDSRNSREEGNISMA
jgi:hypothetical protein